MRCSGTHYSVLSRRGGCDASWQTRLGGQVTTKAKQMPTLYGQAGRWVLCKNLGAVAGGGNLASASARAWQAYLGTAITGTSAPVHPPRRQQHLEMHAR